MYRKAVDIIDAIYGEGNVKSALAHEDLAYALYVQDYNSGDYVRYIEIKCGVHSKRFFSYNVSHFYPSPQYSKGEFKN